MVQRVGGSFDACNFVKIVMSSTTDYSPPNSISGESQDRTQTDIAKNRLKETNTKLGSEN